MVNLFSKVFSLLFLLLIFLGIPRIVFAEDPLGSWSSTASLPYLLASHASFGFANKVSVVGGSAVTGQSKYDVLTATPSAAGNINDWTTTSLTPTALIWHSLAIKNNFVYILGGREENSGSALDHVAKVFVGDLDNNGIVNSWIQINSLPQGTSLGKAVIVGDRIYYAGGFNGSGAQDEIYYADINPVDGTLGAWTTSLVSLPEPLYAFGMVEFENNIIIVGGANAANVHQSKVYKASVNPDGSLNLWGALAALPESVFRGATIRVDDVLISVGGENGLTVLNKVYYTNINGDGSLTGWNQSASLLPQPVSAASVTSSGDYLYLSGGWNGNYLNTVYYAPVNVSDEINLPVPYYSQNVLPWGPTEYDHAQSIGLSPITMDSWGCAVTSAAMVLNYHNMTEFEDDTPIDPGSLNIWLKDNNGFQTSKPGFGKPFSKFVWSSINILSGELYEASKSAYKLEHVRYSTESTESSKLIVLNDDLTNKQNPAILAVSNALTNMHFVVAKGVESGLSYLINDPEWNYENLAPFGNDFFQLDRYKRATSNASYIEMSTNEGIEIVVVDSEGRKTGKQVIDGIVQTFDEIPNAIYNHQNAISNPNASSEQESLGFGFNEFLLQEPVGGQYTIVLSSLENQTYTLNIAALEANGDDQNFQMTGIIGQSSSDEFTLNYSQNDTSVLDEIVTFDSLINDINSLYGLGEINFPNRVLLLAQAKVAKKLSGNNITKKASINILKAMQKAIVKQKGKGVSENAFNILNNDIEALLLHL